MTTLNKVIVFLGATSGGRHHDYSLLKQAFAPQMPWFEWITLLVDLGFQGIQTDYEGDDIQIPHKKPRKRLRTLRMMLFLSVLVYGISTFLECFCLISEQL